MSNVPVLALVVFALVSSITPGPNNLMLMASGANFGVRRTIPHMLGVGIGFALMIFLLGVGLVGLFDLWPPAVVVLKVVSVGYMLWLAWKIAHSAPPSTDTAPTTARPMSFVQAAMFQWVNPKAWSMALTAVTVYAPKHDLAAVLLVTLAFGLVNLPCVSSWTAMGMVMRRWLTDPNRLRAFNWSMAALLVGSLLVMI